MTDTHVLPPELDQIFRRVQDSAHYMPDWQMEVRGFHALLRREANSLTISSKFLHRSWLMRLTSDPDSEAENVDLHGLQSIH